VDGACPGVKSLRLGHAIPAWLTVLLGMLTAVGAVLTGLYLPAFPAMQRSLRAAAGSAQIALATWFAGLAAGQVGGLLHGAAVRRLLARPEARDDADPGTGRQDHHFFVI